MKKISADNRRSVDQRRNAAWRFIAEYRGTLACRGSVVATWRQRAGQRTGPYFLLVVRDAEGRSRSVYLGVDSPLVAEVRAELASLQTPQRERRVFDRVQRQLRREFRQAQQELSRELARGGLWRKGSEVRGWLGGRPPTPRATNPRPTESVAPAAPPPAAAPLMSARAPASVQQLLAPATRSCTSRRDCTSPRARCPAQIRRYVPVQRPPSHQPPAADAVAWSRRAHGPPRTAPHRRRSGNMTPFFPGYATAPAAQHVLGGAS